MKNLIFKMFLFFFIFTFISAQTINVSGKLTSKPDNIPLANAIVKFYDFADTSNFLGENISNSLGEFSNTLTDINSVEESQNYSRLTAFLSAKNNTSLTFQVAGAEQEIVAGIYSAGLGEELTKIKILANSFTWQPNNLPNGVYILKVTSGKQSLAGKLLKLDNYFTIGPNLLKNNLLPHEPLLKNS